MTIKYTKDGRKVAVIGTKCPCEQQKRARDNQRKLAERFAAHCV